MVSLVRFHFCALAFTPPATAGVGSGRLPAEALAKPGTTRTPAGLATQLHFKPQTQAAKPVR